ncbi:MAG: tyrosine-type recombinase/integrase, partial [Acidimicrobiia bacterium]
MHVYVGRDEVTGKQRYLTRTVRGTKREAEKVCAALVVEASKGKFTTRTSGTLEGLLKDWLAHL